MAYTERYVCGKTYTETKPLKDGKTKTVEHTCDVEAKDAHDDIDIEGIMTACDAIVECANEINSIDKTIGLFTDAINNDVLSINGEGIGELSYTCHGIAGEQLSSIQSEISSIKNAATEFFNTKQESYNIIAKAECSRIHPGQ